MTFQWIPKTIKDSWFGKVKLDYSEDGWYADVCGYVEDSGRDYKIRLSLPSELVVIEGMFRLCRSIPLKETHHV